MGCNQSQPRDENDSDDESESGLNGPLGHTAFHVQLSTKPTINNQFNQFNHHHTDISSIPANNHHSGSKFSIPSASASPTKERHINKYPQNPVPTIPSNHINNPQNDRPILVDKENSVGRETKSLTAIQHKQTLQKYRTKKVTVYKPQLHPRLIKNYYLIEVSIGINDY